MSTKSAVQTQNSASLGFFLHGNKFLFTTELRAHAGGLWDRHESSPAADELRVTLGPHPVDHVSSVVLTFAHQTRKLVFSCLLLHSLPFSITWPPREVAVVTPPTRASLPTLLP